MPESVWSARYDQINAFERILTQNNVLILKFFLHISKDEQKERLLARLDDPTKVWKYSPADLQERGKWDDYQRAYEEALSRCSTEDAPWFLIPANKKWYRNLVVSQIVVETLAQVKLEYPPASFDVSKVKIPD